MSDVSNPCRRCFVTDAGTSAREFLEAALTKEAALPLTVVSPIGAVAAVTAPPPQPQTPLCVVSAAGLTPDEVAAEMSAQMAATMHPQALAINVEPQMYAAVRKLLPGEGSFTHCRGGAVLRQTILRLSKVAISGREVCVCAEPAT